MALPRRRISASDLDRDSIDHLFRAALLACREAGYPVASDVEYESAVNWAVLRSLVTFCKQEKGSQVSWTILLALRECHKTERKLAQLRKGDEAGAKRGKAEASVTLTLPLSDFEVLSFVAAHGRSRAAKLLAVSPLKLRERLDDITLRISRGVNAGEV